MIGKGEHAKAVRVRAELMMVTWVLVTVAGAGILVWNASFLGLWVSDVPTPGSIATLLIVVTAAQFIFIRNDAFIIDLTLDLRPKVLIGIASTGLSLGLAAVFVSMGGGIVGLCIGLLIGRSILTVAYPWLIGRAIAQPLGAQLRGVIRPVLATAVIFAAATSVGREFVVDSWVELVLGSIATAGVVAVAATILGLNASQRRYLLRRARRCFLGRREGRPMMTAGGGRVDAGENGGRAPGPAGPRLPRERAHRSAGALPRAQPHAVRRGDRRPRLPDLGRSAADAAAAEGLPPRGGHLPCLRAGELVPRHVARRIARAARPVRVRLLRADPRDPSPGRPSSSVGA